MEFVGRHRFEGRQFPREFVRRYARIIPDFDEFVAAMNRPLSRTFRVNTLKTTKDRVCSLLTEFDPRPLSWFELGFSVACGVGLGRTLAHFLGLIYVQEAASMVPPLILAPRPGECVLDIAAAPGSKTTQLAAMMENHGLLVANDVSLQRLRGLIGNIDRAGCLNVAVCRTDGISLGRQLAGMFDRVLVDAPCSSEGTLRKSDEALERWSVRGIQRFSGLQKGLIIAGFDALKPGGELVYSTCTIAPEENEGVITHLLAKRPTASLLPVELAGLAMRPAVQEWEGKTFPAEIVLCRRILPQDNDTEAFFVARVQKAGRGCRETKGRRGEYGRQVAMILDRFAIPDSVVAGLAFESTPAAVFVGTPEAMSFDALVPLRRGIRFCRIFPHSIKPASHAMQLLGRWATRNCIRVTTEQAVILANGGETCIEADADDGFVLVVWEGFVLGTGIYRRPVLRSQMPRFRPVD